MKRLPFPHKRTKFPKADRPRHWIVSGIAWTVVSLLIWGVMGVAAILVFGWLAGVALGFDAYGTTTDRQDAQVALVVTLSSAAFFWLVWRWLWRKRGFAWRVHRRVLLVCLILGFACGIICAAGLTSAADHDKQASCGLSGMLATAMGATYPIETDLGAGTAFAIDGDGDLVTAYHVIDGAHEIYMNLESGKVPVRVLRTAPDYDLALLRTTRPTSSYLPLDTSYAQADQVYAVGWPGNTFEAGGASVSTGIISRLLSERDLSDSGADIPPGLQMVQTDAAINPGNSGGPLVGACGVLGVVDAKSDRLGLQDYGVVSEEGISYAISAQTLKAALGL